MVDANGKPFGDVRAPSSLAAVPFGDYRLISICAALVSSYHQPSGNVTERIRHVYCHCIATNVGATLCRDRSDFELLFLRSPTSNGLITGDQPVVNLLATHDGTEPSELALYYPLFPLWP